MDRAFRARITAAIAPISYRCYGFSIVLIGLVMIVLPGPAIIIVPLGFAILASEFAWARRVWRRGTILVSRIRGRQVSRQPVETR